jgi:ABC-type transport system involved in multi-copper enzyme maturation permease subunit
VLLALVVIIAVARALGSVFRRFNQPTLFAMLVLMALVTTFATAPILELLRATPEPTVEGESALR